ncbi:MAG: flagellar biosynthetic protein FliQ [Thermaerobacter sp.]|nr:flagellar biosynthetic protein FliQ [Thermaerobacter sp.]
MGVDSAIQVAQNGLITALLVSAPILGLVLFVGLIISLVQAVTGLQEQTLSFVPKILAVGVVLLVLGPWMLLQLVGFSAQLYAHIGVIVGQ